MIIDVSFAVPVVDSVTEHLAAMEAVAVDVDAEQVAMGRGPYMRVRLRYEGGGPYNGEILRRFMSLREFMPTNTLTNRVTGGTDMSTRDVINWPDRIDEFAFFQESDQVRGLINALDEVVMEDTSADEDYTMVVVDDTYNGRPLPDGIIMVRMMYDGQSDRECVLDHWLALLERCMDGNEIVRGIRTLEADEAFQTHMQRRRQFGDLVTRRQREAAARRRQESQPQQEFRIQWNDTEIWHTPDVRYVIREMDDAMLWHTVIWLVRNQEQHAYIYTDIPPHMTPALAAAIWLRQQPAFRALLKESIRRCFTFPADVFNYCKQYVLDKSNTLDGYQPWHDPQATSQPRALEALLDMPDVPPELDMNKDLRSIEL